MCYKCQFIPEIVLEKLREEGFKIDTVVDPLYQKTQVVRSRGLLAISENDISQKSMRFVYDSKNQRIQRNILARKENDPPTGEVDIDSVYDHAGIILEFLRNELHWESIDDNGMNIILNVHYDRAYNNAYWDGDEMTFGDGDGELFTSFARSLEVTGHELVHGVIQYTAGLDYESQPGALNEHFADVFGIAIKQYHLHQNQDEADWLIGKDIMGPKLKGKVLRSMKNPSDPVIVYLPQPSHMNNYYTGFADNQGVHINSGIPNHAFYLVAQKTGTLLAAKWWFAALKVLKQNSKFIDLYRSLKKRAEYLAELPGNAEQILDDAFRKVGIIA